MGIQHLDVSKGGYSRVTFSKNLAFFTGHAAPQYQTLKEQAEGILKRYDELFKQFGLKKSNILQLLHPRLLCNARFLHEVCRRLFH